MRKQQLIALVIFALLAVLCVLQCGLTAICLRNLILLGALCYLSMTDLQQYIIPDRCLLAAVLAWFGAIPFAFDAYGGLAGILLSVLSALAFGGGMLVFTVCMDRLLQKETMGGGDIKLFAVTGLYLGFTASLLAMFFACILGLCFAIWQSRSTSPQVPFGPSIAIACWVMLLYGEPILQWYLQLF